MCSYNPCVISGVGTQSDVRLLLELLFVCVHIHMDLGGSFLRASISLLPGACKQGYTDCPDYEHTPPSSAFLGGLWVLNLGYTNRVPGWVVILADVAISGQRKS